MIFEGMYTDPTNFPVLFFFPFLGYKRNWNWNCKSLSKISKNITKLLLKYNAETFCQLNFSGCALQEVDIVSRWHFACYMVWYKTYHVDLYATARRKAEPPRNTPTQSLVGRGYVHFALTCVWPADARQEDVSKPPAPATFLLYCYMHFDMAMIMFSGLQEHHQLLLLNPSTLS